MYSVPEAEMTQSVVSEHYLSYWLQCSRPCSDIWIITPGFPQQSSSVSIPWPSPAQAQPNSTVLFHRQLPAPSAAPRASSTFPTTPRTHSPLPLFHSMVTQSPLPHPTARWHSHHSQHQRWQCPSPWGIRGHWPPQKALHSSCRDLPTPEPCSGLGIHHRDWYQLSWEGG